MGRKFCVSKSVHISCQKIRLAFNLHNQFLPPSFPPSLPLISIHPSIHIYIYILPPLSPSLSASLSLYLSPLSLSLSLYYNEGGRGRLYYQKFTLYVQYKELVAKLIYSNCFRNSVVGTLLTFPGSRHQFPLIFTDPELCKRIYKVILQREEELFEFKCIRQYV